MKCPACSRELSEVTVGGLNVDVCRGGCGGIWFDNFELQKVDEAAELNLERLLDVEHDPSVRVDFAARRHCPRCLDIVLMRHGYGGHRAVQVDSCPKCGGVWLDAGELAQIRKESAQKDRKHIAEEYFNRLFQQELARFRARREPPASASKS